MAPKLSAEDRRMSILLAAIPLFAQNGFNGTTTKQIAKAAKVSEALLYRHFPSKEALYQELQTFCSQAKQDIERVLTTLVPSTSTLVYMVYYLVHHIFEGPQPCPDGMNHTDMNRMMINSFLEDGTFARMFIQSKVGFWAEAFLKCLEAAQATGDIGPTEIEPMARIWFVHHLGVSLALLNLPDEPVIDYGFPKSALVDQAVRFSLRGMGLTDAAIATHYNPTLLALFVGNLEKG